GLKITTRASHRCQPDYAKNEIEKIFYNYKTQLAIDGITVKDVYNAALNRVRELDIAKQQTILADISFEDHDVTFIRRNGGVVLFHDGYQYVMHKKQKNGTDLWRCNKTKKIPPCRASLVLRGQEVIKRAKHVCQPDSAKNTIEKIFYAYRALLSVEGSTVTNVYNAAVNKVQELGLDTLSKVPTLRQVKNNWYPGQQTQRFGTDIQRFHVLSAFPPQEQRISMALLQISCLTALQSILALEYLK
ncbi:hypothetical protein ACJJTC_012611, partial [Scirpophaga incertulas]